MPDGTSQSIPPMPDSAKDYLKEEQKQRRQEIENLIARNESDQRHGLIITGVIWSWLATNTKSFEHINFNIAIVTLPAVIMGFYFYRRRIIDKQIRTIAEYMRALEKLFEVTPDYGWESWLFNKRKTEGLHPLNKPAWIFWGLLFLSICLFAILFLLLHSA